MIREDATACRAGRVWLLAIACTILVLLGAMGLAGCAAPASGDDASASSSAEAEPEHEPVSLRVAAPLSLQGVLLELADAYAADKDWLSFNVQVYASAKKENAAIAPIEALEPDPEDQPAASSGENCAKAITISLSPTLP